VGGRTIPTAMGVFEGGSTRPPGGDVVRVRHVDDEPMVTETVARRLERVDERRSVASATSVRAALDRPQG